MPRVSQQHLDARRRLILDAARKCFARSGFHATSMQDILGEARMSAGGLYRYFAGKEEIVIAVAVETQAELMQTFDEAARVDDDAELPPLEDVLAAMLERLGELDETAGIAVQMWAEAPRAPALAERLEATLGFATRRIAALLAHYQEARLLDPEVDAEEIARATLLFAQGYLLQRTLTDAGAESYRAGLRALLAGS